MKTTETNNQTNQTIAASELHSLHPKTYCMIDVREPIEYAEEHIQGAKLIPLSELEKRSSELNSDDNIVVMCRSGKRGNDALHKLKGLGFTTVQNLEGGILAWKSAGLPINRSEKKVFPLMQQVQITIGMGVLIGAVLSKTVDSNWIFLSGFFGAGLLFAGITGWCGLALLMSKMPWNHVTITTCKL